MDPAFVDVNRHIRVRSSAILPPYGLSGPVSDATNSSQPGKRPNNLSRFGSYNISKLNQPDKGTLAPRD